MDDKILNLIEKLTLEEKLSLISGADFWHSKGIERLGVPSVMMCDGPHGLRKQDGEGDHLGINESIQTVCYPTASALASSFDCEVLSRLGEALGKECQAENVGMLLGPGVNMKRSPLCGRNFEYFSEDPYLTGKLAVAFVKSLQDQGVAACVKHFAANNQESYRMSGSSNLNERTLHETYLPAFEMTVKEGKARSIMCAYNGINGTFCAENEMLLTKILREKWGFEGFVVTDWGAAKDPVKGIKAGLDLIMPGGQNSYRNIVMKALENGELKEQELDKAVANILKFAFDYREMRHEDIEIDRNSFAELSGQLAAECAVLLKNDDILPLSKREKVAFIGEFAEKPRYQGSGSSHINVAQVSGAINAVHDLNIIYAQGYKTNDTETDEVLLEAAVNAANNAEIAVIFAGLPNAFETEGVDRALLELPQNQNKLIEAVCAVQPNTVVVLHGGAPMLLPWIDKVKAVLCMYLGGQQVGEVSVKLLYGDMNPSGKLAETWPLKLSDNPSYLNFPGVEGSVDYQEGIFIGYRYYDKKEMDVQFPFGYGLSYTSFAYSNLKMDKKHMTDEDILTVRCKVKNMGSRKGKEVVQLYVGDEKSTVSRPLRELKGFVKLELEPGEEKEATFTLDKRSFAYYEPTIHDWFVETGVFTIEIGASSRDIRLIEKIEVQGMQELPVHYTQFTPTGSLRKTEIGRVLLEHMIDSAMSKDHQKNLDMLGEGSDRMMESMMFEAPLGNMVNFGTLTPEQLEEMLVQLNKG